MNLELIPQAALEPIKSMKLEDRITLNPDALAVRDELLETVKKACLQVTNPAEQKTATAYAKELSRWLKDVDANQKAINDLLLPLQRRSKRLSTEASEPVETLLAELKSKLMAFTASEDRRVARENAEREAKIAAAARETDRLNREVEERQRQIEADRLEAERLQRVAAEQVAAAKNKEQREAAAEAQRQADEASKKQASQADIEAVAQAELAAYRQETAERQAMLAPVAVASRQTGQVNRKVKRWKLQADPEAVHRLYAHNRALVRLEANAQAIGLLCFPEPQTPGIEVWFENDVSIRGT
jgi:hypothetical protein